MRAFSLLALGVVGIGLAAAAASRSHLRPSEPAPGEPSLDPGAEKVQQASASVEMPKYVRDVYDRLVQSGDWLSTGRIRKMFPDRSAQSIRQALWRLGESGMAVGRSAADEPHPLAKEWRAL